MQDCIFCSIVSGEMPAHKVYEDENVVAFLDIHPVNTGHTLVIPKEHYADILEAPQEVVEQMVPAIYRVAAGVKSGLNADAFNITMNNGKEAGQAIAHMHFHIIPRFPGDGHELWRGHDAEEEELTETAESIKANIS